MDKPLELLEYIHASAASEMKTAVGAAGGNEVFFLGKTDKDLIVRNVEVLARGDAESVPASARKAALSDVVIHNHPDGVLTPSKADLSVAAQLGDKGIGFYIVDNALEKIYPVVLPSHPEERAHLDPERLALLLKPGGAVPRTLPDYEYREEQCRMLEAVIRAFNEDKIALIEAGTGTGKSLAYLIPAIAWSLLNGERVVVSTNTINLQEQLIGKDLPMLKRIEGLDCRAVLVKGRSNYICLRKLASAREERQLLSEGKAGDEIDAIGKWSEKTLDGSLADLGFIPRPDNWERLCAEADQCTRLHCRFYEGCFFYKARRAASAANLLVANHHLLMADLAVRNKAESYEGPAVLPRFHRVVIDEAQHLEDVATEYLGFRLSKYALLKMLWRLQSPRDSRRGLLPFIGVKLRMQEDCAELGALITDSLLPERLEFEGHIHAAFDRLASELLLTSLRQGNAEPPPSIRITAKTRDSALWRETLCPVCDELIQRIESFSARLNEFLKAAKKIQGQAGKALDSARVEMTSMRCRAAEIAGGLRHFMEEGEEYCRWLELKKAKRGGVNIVLCSAPLDVSRGLREALYDRFGTIAMTSATMTVGAEFDYFTRRLGLDDLEAGRLECTLLPSPFDYRSQALIAAPRNIAEPDSPGYETMLEDMIREATVISGGRAFVLFTSYRLLDRLYAKLMPQLDAGGMTPLRQGGEHRTALLNRFRREKAAVLFATDSFWEGVDVKGEALECVIITRLPFRVPSEPIQQARVEAIQRAGGDAFLDYSVPQAVIKFRQGFGRLIRHRDDVGAVLILDARVRTRKYGALFLNSLPTSAIRDGNVRDTLSEMECFFKQVKRPASAAGATEAGKRRGGERRSRKIRS